MSIVCNLSPLLFLTFRELYGISYSLLGTLVLINFVTQLTIDLIFSFFSHKFPIPTVLKGIPVLTVLGLLLYALAPVLFPSAVYFGLAIGTVLFSVSSGLAEVLISPVVAALPSDNPERDLSKLHSVYAWGVVGMILFGTLFLLVFQRTAWQWLSAVFALVPALSALLFAGAEIPKMETPERTSGALKLMKSPTLWLCFFAIFLGGASECTMAQWSSGYLEKALGIDKVWGDVFGMAAFSVALGLGRTLYSKIGKKVERVLLLGAIGAAACYLVAALSSVPFVGLIACALTGLCVSMMWPGSLIVASEKIPQGGVFVFAMMAAGGDLGASVGPQLVGVVTDAVAESAFGAGLSESLGLAIEQVGMKCGMLVGALFPIVGIAVYALLVSMKKKKRNLPLQ